MSKRNKFLFYALLLALLYGFNILIPQVSDLFVPLTWMLLYFTRESKKFFHEKTLLCNLFAVLIWIACVYAIGGAGLVVEWGRLVVGLAVFIYVIKRIFLWSLESLKVDRSDRGVRL